MRNPNGYGSVIDLGKNRRKRYAARIPLNTIVNKNGKPSVRYRYIGYFEDRKSANICLATYNMQKDENNPEVVNASIIKKSEIPTFEYVYERFLEYKKSKVKKLSESSFYGYNSAYKRLSGLHGIKMPNITYELLQGEINNNVNMSKGTMTQIRNFLKQIYSYAIKSKYVKEDISALCDYEVKVSEKAPAHKPFTNKEIGLLWKRKDDYDAGTVLIMIYTGMRITELLTLTNDKIDMENHCIHHGIKTAAGKNRTIPIHDAIYPIVKNRYHNNNDYFIPDIKPSRTRQNFYNKSLTPLMNELCMDHIAHDTRYTCASLMKEYEIDDYYRKVILGHAITDITNGIYTKTTTERLLSEINRIQIPCI